MTAEVPAVSIPTPTPMPPPRRTHRWLLIGLAVIGLTLDQASKHVAFQRLYDGTFQGTHEVVPGWFRLNAEYDPEVEPADGWVRPLQLASAPVMPRVNHGALFGLGGGQKGRANLTFAVVSGLAAVGIVAWGLFGPAAEDRWLSVALGLILGGTLGNLYDRLVFGGVRDFLYFYKINWPVFNYADCTLVVGAAMLFLHAVVVRPPPKKPA